MKPTKKEIPRGAMVDVAPGVPAPAAVVRAPRAPFSFRIAPYRPYRRSPRVAHAKRTARVAAAAAARSRRTPGLPRNAPTPRGYTSFGMRGDAREANEYAHVRRGATRRDFGDCETDSLGVSGRVPGTCGFSGRVPHRRNLPVPHARAPRLRAAHAPHHRRRGDRRVLRAERPRV